MEPLEEAPSETDHMFSTRRANCCCCCCFPRFRSWGHAADDNSPSSSSSSSWWRRGLRVLMMVRERSELVAGPRWKTFIRRFNRNGSNFPRNPRFQYDPLSYSLNFDEGPNENDADEVELRRSFSARFAAPSPVAAAKTASVGPGV